MFVSIFYIVCGFLGYLIVLITSLKIKSNKAINSYLTLVITLIATRHLINGLSYFLDTIYFHKLIISSNRFFIFIVPSLYLYFREIIFPKNSFSVKDSVLTPIKQEYYSKFQLLITRLSFSLKLDVYPGSIFP